MIFSGQFTSTWKASEVRQNKFVFIGRNLPKEKIEAEFEQLYVKSLRFELGAPILAFVGGYKPGTVIAQWDETNAYRLKLADGREVWAPIDEDDFVKDGSKKKSRRGSGSRAGGGEVAE